MTDPETIAAGLTDARRNALLGPENVDLPAGVAMFLISHRLICASSIDIDGWCWTEKGLAVREVLERSGERG